MPARPRGGMVIRRKCQHVEAYTILSSQSLTFKLPFRDLIPRDLFFNYDSHREQQRSYYGSFREILHCNSEIE
jgi:hypothetical protein